MILKTNLGLLSSHLTYGSLMCLGGAHIESLNCSSSHVTGFLQIFMKAKYAPGLVGTTVHDETLFCSPRSSDRKHMNRLFSKLQLFAYCFQNFCLYAHCLIHMAYERWIHSFIYFRPTVSRNTHKGTSYYYIDFFLTSIKHRTLKEKHERLHINFPI